MHMTRGRTGWAALAVAGVAGVMWLLRPAPLEVELHTVEREALRVTIEEPGLTRMPHHAEVSAPSSGRLTEALVAVGDSVTAGQVVAELRPAPLDARAAAEAEAARRGAVAHLAEAEALVRQAEVALEEARRARARAERLAAAGGVSPRDVEVAVDQETLRARDRDATRARARAAAADVRRATAATQDSGIGGRGAPIRLRAPMSGRILRVFEDHDRVVPAGTPLLEVGDPSQLEVVLDVLSRDAASVREGVGVTFQLPSGDTVPGAVTRVEPAAFTKVSALGISEQRVRVIARPSRALPGIGDRFELPSAIVLWEGRDVLTVPASALVPAGDGWGVFVVRDGAAHRVALTLGHRGSRALEVVGGVSPGDRIVVLPDDRVTEGVRVRAPP